VNDHVVERSADIKADGFGIGWYDPVEIAPSPSPLKAVANPAPQALLQQSQPEREPSVAPRIESSEAEKEQEVLRQRELEQEMENERPCVFKSISPVSLLVPSVTKLIPGMEQCQSDKTGREDQNSFTVVSLACTDEKSRSQQCACTGINNGRCSQRGQLPPMDL
jgi:hypothetical protein